MNEILDKYSCSSKGMKLLKTTVLSQKTNHLNFVFRRKRHSLAKFTVAHAFRQYRFIVNNVIIPIAIYYAIYSRAW